MAKRPATWVLAALVALLGAGTACRKDAAAALAGAAVESATDSAAAIRRLSIRRTELREAFRAAGDDARGHVRREAARTLEQGLIGAVLPRWDGTAWSFSGTSTSPGKGSIACGYFVSTALEEAGLRVERAKLAQQPAEDIIKTLVPPSAIERFSNAPIEAFIGAVARRGEGLYIVGLDIHVGFLIVKSGEVLFHHSSYVPPTKFVREPAATSVPIVTSKYRVIGKLFTDKVLIDAWLDGAPIPTKTRPPRVE